MSANPDGEGVVNESASTRVFISYSWEDPQHSDRILGFTQRLRREGINAWIDRFTPFPVRGWDRWMQDEIKAARFVLCVITKTYAERFLGDTPYDVGRGGNWEGSIITNRIYQDGGLNEKFIPILFDQADAQYIPFPLSKYTHFCVSQPIGYDDLYRLLTSQPKIIPEEVRATHKMTPVAAPVPLSQPEVFFHRRNLGNLPRIPYFVGREDQLKTIDAALKPSARTWIILIDGPGGIGKTTLAIRAAENASEEDYPRIVFASAKVRELGPDGVRAVRDFLINSYLDLLNTIARELGDEALAKLEEKERPEALLRLLRDKPALLVLDNLESFPKDDLERLLEFLKHLPHRTKAIITSRRRNDIQAECIRLDKMAWPPASKLLDELARTYPPLEKATEAERHALYQETGGNPLILRWIASQFRPGRGRCRTVKGALKLLKGSPAGDTVLSFIFGHLAKTFNPVEAKLLAVLTYFTEPVEIKHIAELAEVSELVAQDELESLVDSSLVIADAEMRHFILTPLVADFLRRHKPEVVRASGDRIADQAYALAVDNGGRRYHRFHLLEKAWPTVEAALPLLDYDKLQTVCDYLADFFGWAGRLDESIALNRLTEEKAVAQKDFLKAGWRACGEAYVMFLRRNGEGVHAAAERAASHWQKASPSDHELGILGRRRGMGYELQGDNAGALAAYRETLKLWRGHSTESEDVARVLNDIAEIERQMKDYDAAERDYQEALRIARNREFTEGIIRSIGNRAELALDREQWADAEARAREALSMINQVFFHRELMAVNYRRLAQALAHQDRHLSGLFYARKAVEILTELRSPELSKAKEALRELEEPLRDLDDKYINQYLPEEEKQPLPAAPEVVDPVRESRDIYKIGVTLQEQGAHKEAETRFREALAILQESPKTTEMARIYNSLGWTLQQQKQLAEAEQCYHEALAICNEINDYDEQQKTEENFQKLRMEWGTVSHRQGDSASALPRPLLTLDYTPFEPEIQAYEREDLLSSPPKGVLLFYGSSSIRSWPELKNDFPHYPMLNRGFGGAMLRDCVSLYPRLVKPYSPRVIILYAGDNDLANDRSPQQILDSLTEFLDLVSKDFPSTAVAFISIKPSPARRDQEIEETNRLIKDLASRRENLAFLNIYDKMLKPDSSPDKELFLDDKLHMNRSGYDIWKEVVMSYLSTVWPQPVNPQPAVVGLKREYHKWSSPNVGCEMELLVFGHAGVRMLMFPTWGGRFYQYEDHGMVEVVREHLESGRLQLFCVDSFDAQALHNREISPRERILRHINFEKYILGEVLPFSESKNSNPSLIAQGCSLGASHAVNIAFRHPTLFRGVLALSGRYDLTRSFDGGILDLFDGYYDEDIYFNTPSHFVPNITDPELLNQLRKLDITLAVGEADPFLGNNRAFSQALWDKGIWHTFHVWTGKGHSFLHWREMLRLYELPDAG